MSKVHCLERAGRRPSAHGACGSARRAGGLAMAILLLPATMLGSSFDEETLLDQLGSIRGDTLYVTLDKTVAMALAHNEMLAASQATAAAAGAEALGAWRGFLPQVKLGAFRIRSDDPLSSFAFKLNQRTVTAADFAPDYLNDPGVAENNVMQLKLQQPLFNGGMSIQGKRAADDMSRAATYDHVRAADAVEFQAIQAYQGLALAKAFELVVLDAIEAAEGHLRQARALYEAEMATEADLLQARVHLTGLEQRLIEVRNLVAVAGENIKLLVALQTDLPLAPAEALQKPASLPLPPSPGEAELAERADLRARKHRADAAGKMTGVARGAMLPHVNLSAERNFYSDSDLFGDDARSWTVGIYGTWNIFAGLQNIGDLKRARAMKRAADYMYDFDLRRARFEATQAWLTAKAARDRVQVAEVAVQAATESLRIVTNQYREGLASMVDLLDTQAAATRAEGDFVQALHDYNVGLAQLRYAGVSAEAMTP